MQVFGGPKGLYTHTGRDEEMDLVYILWHKHPTGAGENNEKFIGVYASEEAAKEAQCRLLEKPGFSSFPEGFRDRQVPGGKGPLGRGIFH